MSEQIINVILDESKWFSFSLTIAFIGSFLYYLRVKSKLIWELAFFSCLNLLFGITISTMAFGHLLAISIKLFSGTLEGSLIILYSIGAALLLPAIALINYALSLAKNNDIKKNKGLITNSWMATTLLIAGLPNIPLAIPGLLNIIYLVTPNQKVRKLVIAMALLLYLFLIIGSIIFFMSGRTFEEFSAS